MKNFYIATTDRKDQFFLIAADSYIKNQFTEATYLLVFRKISTSPIFGFIKCDAEGRLYMLNRVERSIGCYIPTKRVNALRFHLYLKLLGNVCSCNVMGLVRGNGKEEEK